MVLYAEDDESQIGSRGKEVKKMEKMTLERTTAGTEVAEVVAQFPEGIQAHLRRGKAHFDDGLYAEALKEFEELIRIAPGHIEARVWIRRAKEGMIAPRTDKMEATAGGKVKECLWMKLGMVSYRTCTNSYDCLTCEFDQQMQEKMAKGDAAELEITLKKFESLPGNERVCRYALKGDVAFRLCSRCFRCATCEFDQAMEDVIQEKLVKLANRRDALKRKGTS
jgi:tetratricopeptide (TPR) repeat protein